MGVPAADEGPNPELIDMRRRFIGGAFFAVPLLAMAMGDMLPGVSFAEWLPGGWFGWIQLVLASPVAPGIFPPAFRDPSGSVALYFESAAVITVLVLLGQVLELRARDDIGADELLRLVASLERASEHPLAAAMSLSSVSVVSNALRLRRVAL